MEPSVTTVNTVSGNHFESATNYPLSRPYYPLPFPQPRTLRRSWLPSVIGLLLALLILAAVGIVSLYGYIAWVLARPHVEPLQSNPLQAIGLPYENVTFSSDDKGMKLEGWYIPAAADMASPNRAIVFSHGYGGNREEIWVPIYELARSAHEQGFHVLMFDYGYVYHPDRVVTGGARESYDLLGAIEYVRSRGAEEVAVWGFSMGAGTALQAALQSDRIDAMILDSTFVLEPDTLYHNLIQYADLPREPSLTLLRWLYPLINGSGMDEVPYEEIKSTAYSIPTFFIHGTLDERSPYEIIRGIALQQSSQTLSEHWIVPGATHELVYRKMQDEYMQRTAAFLTKVFP